MSYRVLFVGDPVVVWCFVNNVLDWYPGVIEAVHPPATRSHGDMPRTYDIRMADEVRRVWVIVKHADDHARELLMA